MHGGAILVDEEPNEPMRVVGELEPLEVEVESPFAQQQLQTRYTVHLSCLNSYTYMRVCVCVCVCVRIHRSKDIEREVGVRIHIYANRCINVLKLYIYIDIHMYRHIYT